MDLKRRPGWKAGVGRRDAVVISDGWRAFGFAEARRGERLGSGIYCLRTKPPRAWFSKARTTPPAVNSLYQETPSDATVYWGRMLGYLTPRSRLSDVEFLDAVDEDSVATARAAVLLHRIAWTTIVSHEINNA